MDDLLTFFRWIRMAQGTRDNVVTKEDFLNCEAFFSRPLPDLFRSAATCLDDINMADGAAPILERLCLLLDQLGVECWKWPVLVMNKAAEGVEKEDVPSCD